MQICRAHHAIDFIAPLIDSLVEGHKGSELVSPAIVELIRQDDLTCFFKGILSLNFRSFSENRDYNNFILRCRAVIEEITTKHKSIFYTTHEDRFILSKAITILTETSLYHLLMNQNNDAVISELKNINHQLETFNQAIQICESFKEKRILKKDLLELPINIQKHIFSLVPDFLQKAHFEKIKYIYIACFKQSIFNKDILPSLLNKGICWYPSILEIAESAPHVKSIDISEDANKILPKILKVMHMTELRSVRRLKITSEEIFSNFKLHIDSFTNLKELKIRKHSPFSSLDSLTSHDITKLSSLKNLQKMELVSLNVLSIQSLITTVAKMPALKTLSLGIWVNHDNLKELAPLKELKSLEKLHCIAYTNCEIIKHKHIIRLLDPLRLTAEIRWFYSPSKSLNS